MKTVIDLAGIGKMFQDYAASKKWQPNLRMPFSTNGELFDATGKVFMSCYGDENTVPESIMQIFHDFGVMMSTDDLSTVITQPVEETIAALSESFGTAVTQIRSAHTEASGLINQIKHQISEISGTPSTEGVKPVPKIREFTTPLTHISIEDCISMVNSPLANHAGTSNTTTIALMAYVNKLNHQMTKMNDVVLTEAETSTLLAAIGGDATEVPNLRKAIGLWCRPAALGFVVDSYLVKPLKTYSVPVAAPGDTQTAAFIAAYEQVCGYLTGLNKLLTFHQNNEFPFAAPKTSALLNNASHATQAATALNYFIQVLQNEIFADALILPDGSLNKARFEDMEEVGITSDGIYSVFDWVGRDNLASRYPKGITLEAVQTMLPQITTWQTENQHKHRIQRMTSMVAATRSCFETTMSKHLRTKLPNPPADLLNSLRYYADGVSTGTRAIDHAAMSLILSCEALKEGKSATDSLSLVLYRRLNASCAEALCAGKTNLDDRQFQFLLINIISGMVADFVAAV